MTMNHPRLECVWDSSPYLSNLARQGWGGDVINEWSHRGLSESCSHRVLKESPVFLRRRLLLHDVAQLQLSNVHREDGGKEESLKKEIGKKPHHRDTTELLFTNKKDLMPQPWTITIQFRMGICNIYSDRNKKQSVNTRQSQCMKQSQGRKVYTVGLADWLTDPLFLEWICQRDVWCRAHHLLKSYMLRFQCL